MLVRKNLVALVLFLIALILLVLITLAAQNNEAGGIIRFMWFGGGAGATLVLFVLGLLIFLFGRRKFNPRMVGGVLAAIGLIVGLLALVTEPGNQFLIPYLKNAGIGGAIAMLAVAAYVGTRKSSHEQQGASS